jgi:hypothetical protein
MQAHASVMCAMCVRVVGWSTGSCLVPAFNLDSIYSNSVRALID